MQKEIIENIQKICDDFLMDYAQNYIDTGSVASGKLATSGRAFINVNGDTYSITFGFADYWKWAEYGRKPGKFPPLNKIKEWIRIKPVLPRAINGKLPTENQLAYLISRKIALKGTNGTGVYDKTVNEFDLINKLYNIVGDSIVDSFMNSNFFDAGYTFQQQK